MERTHQSGVRFCRTIDPALLGSELRRENHLTTGLDYRHGGGDRSKLWTDGNLYLQPPGLGLLYSDVAYPDGLDDGDDAHEGTRLGHGLVQLEFRYVEPGG